MARYQNYSLAYIETPTVSTQGMCFHFLACIYGYKLIIGSFSYKHNTVFILTEYHSTRTFMEKTDYIAYLMT